MKVLMIGCGAVGLGLAASLYDAGVAAHLVAHGATYDAVKKDGIARRGIFREVAVPAERVKVFESIAQTNETGYDFVIVSVKTTANEEIAAQLGGASNLLCANGRIVLFQNGFGNEAPFLRYFDKERMCAGIIITGFARPQPNLSVVTVHSAPALIGAIGGGDGGAAPLAAAIAAGGIPCEATGEISKTMWSKMLYNCTLNPLGAILGTDYGGLAKSPDAVELMNRIIAEVFAVMKASGYATHWPDAEAYKKDFYEKILPPTYHHRASTLQDIERKIKTEIGSLTGAVIRLADAHGVDVPCNRMLYRLVRAKESLY